jgi:hypothetical protein
MLATEGKMVVAKLLKISEVWVGIEPHAQLYGLAFLAADSSATAQEQKWFADRSRRELRPFSGLGQRRVRRSSQQGTRANKACQSAIGNTLNWTVTVASPNTDLTR